MAGKTVTSPKEKFSPKPACDIFLVTTARLKRELSNTCDISPPFDGRYGVVDWDVLWFGKQTKRTVPPRRRAFLNMAVEAEFLFLSSKQARG